jgi:hypothetical protein
VSVKVMSRVWDESKMASTELLLLLALADHANDYGTCYPGIEHLAHKTRKSERQVKRLLVKLEAAGELFIPHRNGGRETANRYFIVCGLSQEEIEQTLVNQPFKNVEISPSEAAEIAQNLIKRQNEDIENQEENDAQDGEKGDIQGEKKGDIQGLKGDIQGLKGDIQGLKGDIAMSPESMNRYESSNMDAEAPPVSKKPVTELSDHFIVLSNIPMPTRKSDTKFWWSSLGELYSIAGKDLVEAKRLVTESYTKLVKDGLTVSDPNSLIKTARSQKAAPPSAAPNIPLDEHQALSRQQAQITAELEAASAGAETPINESVLELSKQLNGVFHNAD